jgi:pimeloyl-ACP methyl ester carboxylesterase
MAELGVENRGVRLHVEVDGPASAVPVVFLHGVTSSARTWGWLPAELVRGRRIVRLDFRGHGRSGRAPGTYDVAQHGDDVVAVLRELGAGRAAFVGHSLGGAVVWWLAVNHPHVVGAGFLEDPPLYRGDLRTPENERFRLAFERARASARACQEARLSEAEVAERIGAAAWGPPGAPVLRELACEDAVAAMAYAHLRMDVAVLDGAIDGSTLAPLDLAAPVAPPLTVLAADDARGAVFTTEDEARLARTHPDVRVVRVEGSGHGIHFERRFRETFRLQLERFLDVHAPAES